RRSGAISRVERSIERAWTRADRDVASAASSQAKESFVDPRLGGVKRLLLVLQVVDDLNVGARQRRCEECRETQHHEKDENRGEYEAPFSGDSRGRGRAFHRASCLLSKPCFADAYVLSRSVSRASRQRRSDSWSRRCRSPQ